MILKLSNRRMGWYYFEVERVTTRLVEEDWPVKIPHYELSVVDIPKDEETPYRVLEISYRKKGQDEGGTIVTTYSAYLMNDQGQTIEVLNPDPTFDFVSLEPLPELRIRTEEDLLGDGEPSDRVYKPFRCVACNAMKPKGHCLECGAAPERTAPVSGLTYECLRCGVKTDRLYHLYKNDPAEWMGTHCSECGDQKFVPRFNYNGLAGVLGCMSGTKEALGPSVPLKTL
jgi:hypothetical protein